MSGQYDPRITAYFGDAVLQAGFMPVPNLFLRHYAQLDITTPQAMFLLQLMAIAWDVGSPPTNMTMLSERMGVSRRAVQLISAELAARGIVEIFDQYDDQGAQVENGYNLAPLFEQLAALAPARTPPGQLRHRRSRSSHRSDEQDQHGTNGAGQGRSAQPSTDGIAAPTHVKTPAKKTSSPPMKKASPPPVKKTSPSPGTGLRPAPEENFTAPVKPASRLNKENKNRVKKQVRKEQEQQPAVAVAHVAGTTAPGATRPNGVSSGASLRWGSVLDTRDVAQSRLVLARMGLNADIADVVAPTLHPAECWSLWTYARGARLGPAWIAKQVYDPRRRAPRIAGVPGRYDDAGHLLATLPPATAERILDITDRCCPDEPDRLWLEAIAASPDLPEPELRHALDTIWDALRGERHGADERPRPSGQHHVEKARQPEHPASMHALCWPAVRERLMAHVAPDDWNTWLAPLTLLDIVDGTAVIAVPNLFVRSEVSARFETMIAIALAAELGRELRVELVIAAPALA